MNNLYKKVKINNGFISLTLVISVSSILLAFSFYKNIDIGHFFDQTIRKEYRLMNYYNAYNCIDYAILNLSHDYFYSIDKPKYIEDLKCVIEKVYREDGFVYIETYGNYKKVNVSRKAKILLLKNRLEVLSVD